MRLQTPAVLCLLALSLVSSIASAQSLPFRIVEREEREKGLRYVLFVVKAVLTTKDQSEMTKQNVEATLRELLRTVRDDARRKGAQVDGITAFLYQSLDHLKGNDVRLGSAEWWPKGHSFGSGNVANIENKATYVETVNTIALPKQRSAVASRLPKATRQEIFVALVRSEDRASREAEEKYPTLPDNIPFDKLRTYDWEKMTRKKINESERLRKKYRRELLQKFNISEAELDLIADEADAEKWPLPPLR